MRLVLDEWDMTPPCSHQETNHTNAEVHVQC